MYLMLGGINDRTFLDNVVTQTIASEGEGVWREYVGGYYDWLRVKTAEKDAADKAAKVATTVSKGAEAERKPAAKGAKLSFNEKRELDGLPAKMAALEAEQADLQKQLADPEVYRNRAGEMPKMSARLDAIDEELLILLERWEILEAKG